MPSLSIRQALPILIITPVLITSGITAVIYQSGSRRAVNELAQQLTNRAGEQIDNRVTAYLQQPQIINQTLTNSDRSKVASLSNLAQLEYFFWQQTQNSKTLIYPSYGDEQGNFVGVEMQEVGKTVVNVKDSSTGKKRHIYRLDSDGNRTEKLDAQDYDPRDRPWYKEAVRNGRSGWSPIYLSTSGVMMIAATTPLYSAKEQLRGVLAYNLPLSELSDLLRTANLSRTGQMFILERNGNLVASSAETPIIQQNGKPQRLSVESSNNALIKSTAQHLSSKLGSIERITMSQFMDFKFNGETQFVAIEPIQDGQGIDWLLVIVVPESDFMGAINDNIRSSLWISSAIAGLAALMGLAAALWIIRPLEKLIKAAQDIEEQQFEADHLAKIKTRRDEIGQLARVFEQMADIVYARERQFRDQLQNLKRTSKSTRAIAAGSEEIRFQQLLENAKAVREAK